MIPETAFPHAIPPYRYPVPLPGDDPDTGDKVQVCFNPAWQPYIIGALKSLLLQATWDTEDSGALDLVQQQTFTLLNLFADAAPGCGIPHGALCISGTFQDFDYGYVSNPAADCDSTWVAGVGWKSCINADDTSELWVRRDFEGAAAMVQSFSFHLFTGIGNGFHITVSWYLAGLLQRADTLNVAPGGGDYITSASGVQADAVTVDAVLNNPGSHANIAMDDWKMCYVGAFPLSLGGLFSHTWDFVTGDDGGWVRDTAVFDNGTFVPGTGWIASDVDPLHGVNGWRAAVLKRDWASARTLTSVKIVYSATYGCMYSSGGQNRLEYGGSVSLHNAVQPDVTDDIWILSGSQIGVTEIKLAFTIAFKNNFSGECFGVPLSGSLQISSITVEGIGTDPFI